MKHILLFLLAFLATRALGGVNLPAGTNRSSGGDLCDYVSVSGTPTAALCIKGASGEVNVSGIYGTTPTVLTGNVTIGSSGPGGQVAPTSYTTQSSDSNYLTSATASGSGGSALVTFTLSRAGYYRVDVNQFTASATAGPTECTTRVVFGGTGALKAPGNTQITNEASNAGAQDCSQMNTAIYNVTAAQTITVNPSCWQSFSGGTHTCYATIILTPY